MTAFTFDPAGTGFLGLLVGTIIGASHFGSLWWSMRLYAGGYVVRALIVHGLRFGLLIVVLAGLAKLGPSALVMGLLGLLLARGFILRRFGPHSLGRTSWTRR